MSGIPAKLAPANFFAHLLGPSTSLQVAQLFFVCPVAGSSAAAECLLRQVVALQAL